MKKLILFIFTIFLMSIFLISGCNSNDTSSNGEIISGDDLKLIYSNPKDYKGQQVAITGQVFTPPEEDEDGIYFQMYADNENNDMNTIVGISKDLMPSIKADDFIYVLGEVKDVFEGENLFGARITAPVIKANEIKILSYIEACSPTIKTVEVNDTKTQLGYEITLNKIEFSKTETRVYITIKNNGSSKFSVYSFNAKILQGENQFTEEDNWDADYPKIQTELMVGAKTEGIIAFPPLETSNLSLILEGSSEDWDEDIENYVFDIIIE